MNSLIGRTVKDRINGFSGVVTGYCEYITGCNQALVAPPLAPDGAVRDSHWVDEQRLTIDESVAPLKLDNDATPGFDKPAPKR